jgi:hypothetical protein
MIYLNIYGDLTHQVALLVGVAPLTVTETAVIAGNTGTFNADFAAVINLSLFQFSVLSQKWVICFSNISRFLGGVIYRK